MDIKRKHEITHSSYEDCCIETDFDETETLFQAQDRRSFIKKAVAACALLPFAQIGSLMASTRKVKLAFCGQLLCVVPYEVAVKQGHFKREGLDVELVYTKGGGNAIRALLGGAVEFGASSLDAALGAYAKGGDIVRFATTGQLPLFALAVSPVHSKAINSIKDLEGKKVGISKPGNADHALLLFLLAQQGGDASKINFVNLGTNLYEALRVGHVDAGMIQEPALTLIESKGGKILANLMDSKQAEQFFGGHYEFMGVSVLRENREKYHDLMHQLVRGLKGGLDDTRNLPIDDVVNSIPKQLIAAGDRKLLTSVLEKHRKSLYPEYLNIDLASTRRVVKAHQAAGKLEAGFKVDPLMYTEFLDKS